jgi:SAM-dependent methyltransferase
MQEVYGEALHRIAESLASGGRCLDCGAGSGTQFEALRRYVSMSNVEYIGLERDALRVATARSKSIPIIRADLNQGLPFHSGSFRCVFALSVLEHLVLGCRFLREAYRVLIPGGHLVIVTPNLSAWFNVALLALGRMPSSGPHPDSEYLVDCITPVQFRKVDRSTIEDEIPVDRHLVVFTFSVLEQYLSYLGFRIEKCRGFGLYPFPPALQSFLEVLDPKHCHQMLFDCVR